MKYNLLLLLIVGVIFTGMTSCSNKNDFIPTVQVTQIFSGESSLERIYFPSLGTGLAIGTHGLLLITKDEGKTWNQLTDPDISDLDLITMEFPTPETGFICTLQGTLLKTQDGGSTWSKIDLGPFFTVGSFPTEKIGYFISIEGVEKTTDGGNSWSNTNFNFLTGLDDLTSIHFFTEDSGYVGSAYFGEVSFTYDGGQTWSQAMDYPEYAKTMVYKRYNDRSDFVYSGPLYTETNGAGYEHYNDEGFLGANSAYIKALEHINDTRIIAAGGGIFAVSDDGGETWTEMYNQQGRNFEINDVTSVSPDQIYGIDDSAIYSIEIK